jgi:hypothetical protein
LLFILTVYCCCRAFGRLLPASDTQLTTLYPTSSLHSSWAAKQQPILYVDTQQNSLEDVLSLTPSQTAGSNQSTHCGRNGGRTSTPIPLHDHSLSTKYHDFQACEAALQGVDGYDHEKVDQWSSQIINAVLQSLISATSSSSTTDDGDASAALQYRYNVTCTIIQQGLTGGSERGPAAGRRGMHSASGAYWDVKRDGMWTFKYPAGEEKGLDLVLSVVWFGSR